MAPASAQTHAHNPASYGAYPECVSLRSRPKVPNQDPRAASGPCLLRVLALQERSPRSPACEARRRRKDLPVLPPHGHLSPRFGRANKQRRSEGRCCCCCQEIPPVHHYFILISCFSGNEVAASHFD